MRHIRRIIFLAVGTLGLLLVYIGFRPHQSQPPLPHQRNAESHSTSTMQSAKPTSITAMAPLTPVGPTKKKKKTSTTLMQALTDGSSDHWLATTRELQNLSPEGQWRVLEAPGVADQPYAKLLRHTMATTCSSTLRQIDINARESEFDKSEAVVNWCKNLSRVGTADQIFESSKAEVHDPEWSVKRLKSDKLSDVQKRGRTAALLDRARDAKSVSELRNVIDALWVQHSNIFVRSWAEVARLSRYDEGLLHQTVPIAAACTLAGGCGPDSVYTINYCALMPGFQCLSGMGLNDAIQWNLSPRVSRISQDMVAAVIEVYRESEH